MKAAVIDHNGGPEALVFREIADPVCADDGIVIDVETVSIEGGDTLDEFLEQYPTVSRKQAVAFLEHASERLLATA